MKLVVLLHVRMDLPGLLGDEWAGLVIASASGTLRTPSSSISEFVDLRSQLAAQFVGSAGHWATRLTATDVVRPDSADRVLSASGTGAANRDGVSIERPCRLSAVRR
ncbi:hypothetical protein [Nakamurella lactea]|uniref:hypothetical protein n=1 Tax=Nakamurella lactea TaxID=459515 RepID=UPI0003F63D36|nr:hypothetical protein [Nakamurella lactea]